ncbi:MAG: DegV family protein [Clostridia bacterium]|nr:DegV family protein [Clostridia bacterium]
MKIVADTATLFAPAEGEAQGMTIVPVCVTIDGKTYQDYAEITSEEFLAKIEAGGVPVSSQPAIGDLLDVFESSDEEMLVLTVGDGLSGGYQSALSARSCADDPQRIHVMDSGTLAGPLRYLAKKAVALKNDGLPMARIKEELRACIESSVSFVIPEDFAFLKRSGRLTAITAKIGGTLKLLPVLTQTEDRKRIRPLAVRRTWKAAVETITQRLEVMGVDHRYLINVCHAGTLQKAAAVAEQIKGIFAGTEIEILHLSPALITHGGPGCIVVQAIRK